MDILEYIINTHCTVLGVGVSNLPLTEYLVNLGTRVSARDKKSESELGETASHLRSMGVELICGDDYMSGLENETGVIFRSPGLRHDTPEILKAIKSGAMLISEMELFFEICPSLSQIIGITGSDGKTTTTTLIHRMLQLMYEDKKIYIGGNIGTPLLSLAGEMKKSDTPDTVIELSSFQLQTMKKSPETSVIVNITPNHLNWHTGMDEYTEAKKNIISGGCRHAVLNYSNDITCKIARDISENHPEIRLTYFTRGEFPKEILRPHDRAVLLDSNGLIYILESDGTKSPVINVSDIKLPGVYNHENYMTAIGAVYDYVSSDKILEIARTFGGVEHRGEFVREFEGISFYNSSIDSTPSRTAAAISTFKNRPVTVICGGYDKNIPFEPLADALIHHGSVHSVVLTGDTMDMIYNVIVNHTDYDKEKMNVIREPDFNKAVMAAYREGKSGGIVILAPACASFDAFKNFEERGNRFKEIINSL